MQIDLADEGVGRLDIGYAGQREFLDETIPQRPEPPNGPWLREFGRTPVFRRAMRRIGPDRLDAQWLEADLGRMTPIDLAASFRGAKVMRPAIGVEAYRQAALREDLLQRPEGRVARGERTDVSALDAEFTRPLRGRRRGRPRRPPARQGVGPAGPHRPGGGSWSGLIARGIRASRSSISTSIW